MAIIRAIVAGERDPVKLAQLRNPACKSSEEEIAKALTGTWRAEQLFVLKQALARFDYYTALIVACDAQVEQQFSVRKPRFDSAEDAPPLKPGYPLGAAELQEQEQAKLQCTGAAQAGGWGRLDESHWFEFVVGVDDQLGNRYGHEEVADGEAFLRMAR